MIIEALLVAVFEGIGDLRFWLGAFAFMEVLE